MYPVDNSIKVVIRPTADSASRTGLSPDMTFEAPLLQAITEDHKFAWSTLIEGGAPGAVAQGLAWAKEVAEKSSAGGTWVRSHVAGIATTPPSMTYYLGGYPEHLLFNLNCRLNIYTDPQKDLLSKLDVLRKMTYPDIAEVGFLNQGMFAGYDCKYVTVRIGNIIRLPEAVVQGFSYTYSEAMINGIPAWADIALNIMTKKVVAYKDLDSIFNVSINVGEVR